MLKTLYHFFDSWWKSLSQCFHFQWKWDRKHKKKARETFASNEIEEMKERSLKYLPVILSYAASLYASFFWKKSFLFSWSSGWNLVSFESRALNITWLWFLCEKLTKDFNISCPLSSFDATNSIEYDIKETRIVQYFRDEEDGQRLKSLQFRLFFSLTESKTENGSCLLNTLFCLQNFLSSYIFLSLSLERNFPWNKNHWTQNQWQAKIA